MKHCNHSGNFKDLEAELETKTRPLFGMRSDSLLHRDILWKLKQDFSMFSSECYHHCEVKWSEVAQLCPTLCNPMDCSPQGFLVHGILQARILEWVPISFSRGSSRPRDRTPVSHIAGRHFNLWATQEAQPSPYCWLKLYLRYFFANTVQIYQPTIVTVNHNESL